MSGLAGKKILYAVCYLNVVVSDCSENSPRSKVALATESWAPQSVEFGGVARDSISSRTLHMIKGEGGYTEIPLTEQVQAWADGQQSQYGLVLTPETEECEFSLSTVDDAPGNGYGKLIVKYVNRE